MSYGFIKTAAVIPQVLPADIKFNREAILRAAKNAAEQNSDVILFPELCLTGYTCGDLFLDSLLLEKAKEELFVLAEQTKDLKSVLIVGLPLAFGDKVLNAAAVLHKGGICGIAVKTFLPNYKEFYEKRYFSSAAELKDKTINLFGKEIPLGSDLIFKMDGAAFFVEICEDLWASVPPSSAAALAGAQIIFNLSASNELTGKNAYLKKLIAQQAASCISGYVYSSCGFGESSTDTLFAGNALIYENGSLLAQSERFRLEEQIVISEIDAQALTNERRVNTTFAACAALNAKEFRIVEIDHSPACENLTRKISRTPFIPQGGFEERCQEITDIQALAFAKRIKHTNAKKIVIGVSGGLDSTLALLICKKALEKLGRPASDILGVTMPGFGTTGRTYKNSLKLLELLGAETKEISIKEACLQHFKDIEHDSTNTDIVFENVQARERTQILMDLANKYGGLVAGTGDMSELALGWATYNGDHMSMYGLNCGVPKTLVIHLVKYFAEQSEEKTKEVLLDIIGTPISPELLPADKDGQIAQKTEDFVGPYELHDFFLYYFLRHNFAPNKILFLAKNAFAGVFSEEVIKKWLSVFFRRFFAQQFKRSCLPDGPKIGSVAISPRADLRLPSDAKSTLWLDELKKSP